MPTTVITQETRSAAFVPRLIVLWLANVAGIWLADGLGLLTYGDSFGALLLAALVLALFNTFLRPILMVLSIPFIIVTLGFFMLVVSAAMLWLTSELVGSFDVYGFWDTIGAAIVLALANLVVGAVFRDFTTERTVSRIDEPV